jgi:hypothetical protein
METVQMRQFRVRDLIWLLTIAGVLMAWYVDRNALRLKVIKCEEREQRAYNTITAFADTQNTMRSVLRAKGMRIEEVGGEMSLVDDWDEQSPMD